MIGPLIAGILGAFITSVVVTRAAERLARRRSLLDVPNERSSHVEPTPRIGGLGILAGLMVGWAIAQGPSDPTSVWIVVAGVILATAGLIDDLRHISVLAKYLAQVLAAATAAVAVTPSVAIDLAGTRVTIDGPVAIILATVWLTALINAFNFMDGIDGLVGSVAVVIAVVGVSFVAPDAQPMLVALAAAGAGFLVWNSSPAVVFMGDVGSQFLGLMVGAAMLRQGPGPLDGLPILIVTSPFLFDTGFTLVRRARAGRNLLAGHREHLYQRLVAAGYSHREVSAGYACATAIAGLAAVAWADLGPAVRVALLAMIVGLAATYARWVTLVERR